MENVATKKFTVLKDLEYPKGTAHKVGDVLELNEEQAAKFTDDLIEEVKEEETEVEEEKETKEEEKTEEEEDTKEEKVDEEEKTDEDEKTDEEKGTTFTSAKPELDTYGVYRGAALVKTYTKENHGDDFVELAEKYAERMGEGYEAKEIVVPPEEQPDSDVVNIVTTNDQLVRTFSLRVHGKEYKKLAAQFVEKYGERKGYKIKES